MYIKGKIGILHRSNKRSSVKAKSGGEDNNIVCEQLLRQAWRVLQEGLISIPSSSAYFII